MKRWNQWKIDTIFQFRCVKLHLFWAHVFVFLSVHRLRFAFINLEYCLDEYEWNGLNFNLSPIQHQSVSQYFVFFFIWQIFGIQHSTKQNADLHWARWAYARFFEEILFGEYRICKCLLNVYYFEIFNVKWFNLENDDWCILCMHIWLNVEILEKKSIHNLLYIYLFHFWIKQRKQKTMIGNSKVGYGSTLLGTPYSIIYIHKQSKMNVANKKKGCE